jgi:hypothetical protein
MTNFDQYIAILRTATPDDSPATSRFVTTASGETVDVGKATADLMHAAANGLELIVQATSSAEAVGLLGAMTSYASQAVAADELAASLSAEAFA